MRNLKKVVALVLALSLVLSMATTAFAATTASEQADVLYDLGLFKGYSDTEKVLGLDDTSTAPQALTLIGRALGWEVDMSATTDFEDLQEAKFSDLVPYVVYAVEKGITNGVSDTEFGVANLNGKRMVAWVLRSLGYDFAEAWTDTVELAVIAGLTIPTIEEVLRSDVAAVIYDMLDAVPVGSEMTVIETLVGDNAELKAIAVQHGLIEAAPVAVDVMVESVTATNLKEVVVVFNNELDKDTVVAANFSLNKSLTSSVTLLEDGKTVVVAVTPVTTGQMANQTEYTLTIEKVKDVAGSELAKVEKTFTAFDATLPTVVGVTYTGPKSFEIEFSEPMKTVPTVTVKAGNSTLSVNSGAITGLGTNVLTVPLFSTLTDGTTYAINVTNSTDFAGYVNVIRTVDAPYVKDVTPPTVSVVSATQEYVLVEFSKPVSGLDAGLFSHTFTAWKASKLTAADTYASTAVTSGTKFYVWFNGSGNASTDRPLAAGTTTLNILAKSTSPAAEIVDLWGNKFAETSVAVTVVADTVAPAVKEIKITSETQLTVEFTKNVAFAAANIEILDKDGKAITGVTPSVVEASGVKLYTVNFGKNLAGETIIVNIKDVKDTTLMTNPLAAYSETVTVTDKTAPAIDKVTYDATDKILYVFFTENMDSTTALEKGNYQLLNGSTYTKLATDAAFINGSKTVKFTLNTAQQALVTVGTTKVFIDNVKDVAGNAIVAKLSTEILAHAGAVIPTFTKAEAIAQDKVVVTFNEELGLIDISAFRFNGQAAVAMDVSVTDGKTVATFTLNDAHKLVANYVHEAVSVSYVDAAGALLIKNLFNVSPVHTETKAIADKIKPAVVTDGIVHAAGKITITFSENLNAAIAGSYAQDLVILKGATALVAGVDYQTTVAGAVVTIEKVGGTNLDDASYSVKSVATPVYIRDAQANLATAFTTAKTVTVDTVAPVVTAATENGTSTVVTLTFSEPLAAATVVAANFDSGTAGVPTVAYTAGSTTVTLTYGAAVTAGQTVIIDAAVTDVAGNALAATTFTRNAGAAGAGIYSKVSSAAVTVADTNVTLTITLTNGTFKAGAIAATDFYFVGDSAARFNAGTFVRTSNTVVTVTFVAAAGGGANTVIHVLPATLATSAANTTVAGVSAD